MSIQPQFESYRYIGEVCRLKAQSIIECRLPGSEIGSVLAIRGKAIPTECVCADGEVQYSGKALVAIVYEDGERKICRAERGAEFFHKAEGSLVTPACFAKGEYEVENISWRREGSGLYISLIVSAEIVVFGGKQMEYLSGGEGLICQKEGLSLCRTVCVSGEVEGEDDFDCDYIGDLLLHSEKAIVHHCVAKDGQVEIEGEIALNLCVLRADESVCAYERLTPFRMQVPADEAYGSVTVGARVRVQSARLTASADEENGKSRMLFSYGLSADCFLYIHEDISITADAFSDKAETTVKRQKDGGRYLTKHARFVERVRGEASLLGGVEGEYTLQAAMLPRAEITCRKTEKGVEAEGVVFAEALLKAADGGYKTATLSLPVLFPVDIDGESVEADALVCGLTVRRKKDGVTEAEATLKLSLTAYQEKEWSYISEVEEGEGYAESDCAFSVFLPVAGENLWQTAKRLRCAPESLQKNNPDLQFPLKEGQRIFVYRQIK